MRRYLLKVYLLEVNNRNTRKRCEIYSKLIIKISGIFIVNFEHISHLCSSASIVNFEHVIAGKQQSFTKYLRQTLVLVFMLNGALREGFKRFS